MIKITRNKSDRLSVRKPDPRRTEARAEVIERLRASANAELVTLVNWLKYGKARGDKLPVANCDALRNTITHLETLKAGVQPDWRNVLKLMSIEIHKQHRVETTKKPGSPIAIGLNRTLTEISRRIADGKTTPDMPGRLEHMLQIASAMEGEQTLITSIRQVIISAENALRGFVKPTARIKVARPVKPSRFLNDNQAFRTECAPLSGITDPLIAANLLIAMAERLGTSPVNLTMRAAALKGIIPPGILPELLELLEQDAELTATALPRRYKDDNIRSDGGKLVGQTGIVEGGVSLGAEAQRLITAELKKSVPLTAAQWVSFNTARSALALENDTFKAIEEIRKIAGRFNWRPLAVAVHATVKTPGLQPQIAGDVITLLAQDESLSSNRFE